MSKLPTSARFLDLSDYARPVARAIVHLLRSSRVSSLHLTYAFFALGIASIGFINTGHYHLAAAFLMGKNILDAADGEMARVRNQPSHIGRYLDSIFDFLINLGIVVVLYQITGASMILAAVAFLFLEFQGTIFNYYYLNQRRLLGGDATSKINEFDAPQPFSYESASVVNVLHKLYLFCYGAFDATMLLLEGDDAISDPLPNWYMTLVSTMGLGFQLLLISVALVFQLEHLVFPAICLGGFFGAFLIALRKSLKLGGEL